MNKKKNTAFTYTMFTLDEAIDHELEMAACSACSSARSAEHKQIARWLKELKERREEEEIGKIRTSYLKRLKDKKKYKGN